MRAFSNSRNSRSESGCTASTVPRRGLSTALTGCGQRPPAGRRRARPSLGRAKICCRSLKNSSTGPFSRGARTAATVRIPVSLVGRISTLFSDVGWAISRSPVHGRAEAAGHAGGAGKAIPSSTVWPPSDGVRPRGWYTSIPRRRCGANHPSGDRVYRPGPGRGKRRTMGGDAPMSPLAGRGLSRVALERTASFET